MAMSSPPSSASSAPESGQMAVHRCSFCKQVCEKPKRCSRCQLTHYCGVECQRRHWRVHKKECKTAKEKLEEVNQTMSSMEQLTKGFAQKVTSESQEPLQAAMADTAVKPLHQARKEFQDVLRWNGTDVEMNANDPYGDGDQSRLPDTQADAMNAPGTRGRPGAPKRSAQAHRDMWAAGAEMELLFSDDHFKKMPTLTSNCVLGRHADVEQELAPLSPEERVKRVERRISTLRLTPLMCVIYGALRIQPYPGMDHVKTAEVLIKYGARLDAKDVVGKTVVHYGCSAVAQPLSMDIVRVCVQAWRDRAQTADAKESHVELADIQDRFGTVALHDAVMSGRTDLVTFLCMKCRANPSIRSYGKVGTKPLQMASMFPSMVQIMTRARQHNQKKHFDKCANTGCSASGSKVCTRCRAVRYCSSQCQRAHWNDHKARCGGGCVRLTPRLNEPMGIMNQHTKQLVKESRLRPTGDAAQGEPFAVKIQISAILAVAQNPTHLAKKPMIVYNSDRSVAFFIKEGTCSMADRVRIVKAVQEKGLGVKGYFMCRVVQPSAADNKRKKKKGKNKKPKFSQVDLYLEQPVVKSW